MKTSLGILQIALQIAAMAVAPQLARAGEVYAPTVPEPIGYVSDYARALEPSDERKLAAICGELERKTGVRIRILTVPDVGGQDLAMVTGQIMAAWSETIEIAERSILILDVVNEKRMRIEFGPAITKLVSDEVSQRVQQQILLPSLARGERGQAYFMSVIELSTTIGLEERVALYTVPGYLRLQPAINGPHRDDSEKLPDILLFIPLLVFMVGMARLESKMACATVVFGDAFRNRWCARFERIKHLK